MASPEGEATLCPDPDARQIEMWRTHMHVQTSKRHQQGASLTQRYNEADSKNNALIRMHIAHMYTRGSVTEFIDRSLSEGSLTSSSSPAFLFPLSAGATWKNLETPFCLSRC